MKENKKRPPSSGAHRRRQGNRQNQMHSSHQQSQPFQRNGAHQTSFPAKKPSPPQQNQPDFDHQDARRGFSPQDQAVPQSPSGSSVPQRRPEPACPVFRKCGGCQLQNMDYARQLQFQQRRVEGLLKQFHSVEPIIGMETPYHYRNKVSAAFALARNQQIISGVYQDSTHRIVPVDHCLIEDPKADEIICSIRRLMKSFKLLPYDEVTQKGFLRHVLIKRGFATNQIMVVLVTSTPVFPAKKRFTEALLKLHPEITTILMNLNDRYTSMVLGEQEKVLYGPGKIQDILCGCRFQISAKSFYQINPAQTEALYLKAMEYAGLTGSETVIDAYCGIGTIGLVAAKRGAKKVVGVELNRDAVKDAIENAKLNKLSNAWFCAGDAGEFMLEMSLEKEPADVVFMDPPRAGSDRTFLSSLIALSPQKVVYISCNPETQQCDLRYLTSKGPYRVTRIQPVDMFPHTNHVETVVLLSKLNTKQHIEVELNLDELDLTSAESKATYEEIKAYVLEHTGLKVSHLYIAQVKQKYGIIERENYNKPKSENAKQPKCPPEKEAAITEALKFFGMI